jgi:translation elongation factor EF-Ts
VGLTRAATARRARRQSEVCLLSQNFVMNDAVSVKVRCRGCLPAPARRLDSVLTRTRGFHTNMWQAAVAEAAAQAGVPLSAASFVRLQVGEGIAREATDFAAEVAEAARR